MSGSAMRSPPLTPLSSGGRGYAEVASVGLTNRGRAACKAIIARSCSSPASKLSSPERESEIRGECARSANRRRHGASRGVRENAEMQTRVAGSPRTAPIGLRTGTPVKVLEISGEVGFSVIAEPHIAAYGYHEPNILSAKQAFLRRWRPQLQRSTLIGTSCTTASSEYFLVPSPNYARSIVLGSSVRATVCNPAGACQP